MNFPTTTWLTQAAEQVRNWREEDRRNGIIWNDEQSQEDSRTAQQARETDK